MQLTLERFAHLPRGTIGEIKIPGGPVIYTIERPWDDNRAFRSCIPEGVYGIEWDREGRIKDVPRLKGTEPRTQINIHMANYAYELHGCIAPGLKWLVDNQEPRVAESARALRILLQFINNDGINPPHGWDFGHTIRIMSRGSGIPSAPSGQL